MLVTLGMMIACYCIARLVLVTLTYPRSGPPSRSAAYTIRAVVVLGVLGVGYCAWTLLGQAVALEDRPRAQAR